MMMRKWMAILLALALMASITAVPGLADTGKALVLPEKLKVIGAEAYMGDRSITSVVIPKNVERVEARAFSGCTGLKEVYFGKQNSVTIADDAFEGCGDVHCYAFPGTAGELYALSHGFECDLMEEGSAFLDQALAMVSRYGGMGSILQGADFTTKRLIVRMSGSRLPNISAYHPVEILRQEDGIFFVQFGGVEDTMNCYGYLKNLEKTGEVIFVDPDACVKAIDDVTAAGVVDNGVWDTDDPMGFDVYAPYVAGQSGTGKVTVAIIDSGVKKLTAYNSMLRADGVNLSSDGDGWWDDRMVHGSVIAGVIKDCVGSANVDILPIRVVSGSNTAELLMVALGIQYAIDHGADVINLSLNFEENAYVSYWLEKARAAGIKVIVAAGNGRMDIDKVYPANVPGVIAVSGIDNKYGLSSISNYGDNISYCAPDSYVVTSAYPGVIRKGTSFAAPMVASAFALAKLDKNHSESDLQSSCRQLTNVRAGVNNYGFGLMQLNQLVSDYVTGIQLKTTPSKLKYGQTYTLSWTVTPEYASDKSVTVTSDNTSVVSVSGTQQGSATLKAAGVGKAKITLTANNPAPGTSVTKSFEVNVVRPVTSIKISTPQTTLALGKTLQASVDEVLPTNASNKNVTWTVESKGGAATVSTSGLITASKAGAIRLTAKAADGYGVVSNAIDIEITEQVDPTGIVLTESTGRDISDEPVFITLGETLKLSASVQPSSANQTVTWSATGMLSVDNMGNVTATGAGTGTVTVKTVNGIKATLDVKVGIMPTGITLESSYTCNVGDVFGLVVGFVPQNATETGLTWTSTNASVAKVVNGTITGVSRGTATIIAISKANPDVAATTTVTVRQPATLTFNANGGNVGTQSITVYEGYAVGSLPIPIRDYYTFAGWYTSASGGAQVSYGTTYSSDLGTNLYAHWTLNAYRDSDWSAWSTTPYYASDNREVQQETRTTYTYKTVYHYNRFKYWNPNYNTWYYTFWDCSGQSYCSSGSWQYWSNTSPLTGKWNSDYNRYFYYGPTNIDNGPWYNESTSSEVDQTIYTTWYRYRDRPR